MQLQKLPADGGWRKLHALDELGQQQELYVDGDKNKKMVRTEIRTKRLGALISKHTGEEKVVPQRAEGKVWVGWQPLAWITVESSFAFSVVWILYYGGLL